MGQVPEAVGRKGGEEMTSFNIISVPQLPGIILRQSASCPKKLTTPRFSLPLVVLLLSISPSGAVIMPDGGQMPAKQNGESRLAVSQNRTCRTFTSLADFQNRTSPANRTVPGESAAPSNLRATSGAGLPPWRVELLRRPLRRVIRWATYTIPAEPKFRLPATEMYRETLECGHKYERCVSWEPPAKRRRCRECGRTA